MNPDTVHTTHTDRELHLLRVLEEVTRRRSEGGAVPDRQVIDEHPDLQPDLEEALGDLRRIEDAESRAAGSTLDGESDRNLDADGVADTYPALPSFPGLTVIDEVHRGGQGVVYRAVQEATGRQVALKVLHDQCFASEEGRTRFDQEVRILGQLRHPNIVTIHDSGTRNGKLFLVMDFISGLPLDEFCSVRRLTMDQSLRLLIKICNAVNAAHLHGVVHRDLKPNNIHVDEQGEPHVLDFGLAKLIPKQNTGFSLHGPMTVTGQFVGSLPWSSPEQAQGNPRDVDLRTDVYSLGVIAYHMLTGCFPYAIDRGARDVLTNIIDVEPRPLRALRHDTPDDVDAIVRKCLRKEPGARYQSAEAIAEDVQRYIAKQPVLARAPSTLYQLKKLASRHRLPSALLAAIAILLFCTIVWMAYDQRRDKELVGRAQDAERRASTEAESARAVNEFLVDDLLAGVQPDIAQGKTPTLRDALDAAAERIGEAFPQQPLVEAAVQAAIGQSYASLGLYLKAEPHARNALDLRTVGLGEAHPDTLSSEIQLVKLLCRQGRFSEADILSLHTFDVTQQMFADEDELAFKARELRAMLHLYMGRAYMAEEMIRDLLATSERLYGNDAPSTLATRAVWAHIILVRRSKHAEAEGLYESILKQCRELFGADHPFTLRAMLNVAQMLNAQRKLPEAEAMFDRTLADFRRVFGDDHPETLSLRLLLARLLRTQGRLSKAIDLLRGAMETSRRTLGLDHPTTLQLLEALGTNLGLKAEYEKSEELHREVLDLNLKAYGDNHNSTAHSRVCLGIALARMGRHTEAEESFRRSYTTRRALAGNSESLVSPLRGLVKALAAQGTADEARPFAEELLELRRAAAQNPGTDAYRLNCYARALLTIDPPDLRDKAAALEFALKAYETSSDEYHYNRYILALAYKANGDIEQAVAMLRRALCHIPCEYSEERSSYEADLVRILEGLGDFEAAAGVYRDTLSRRREELASDPREIAESLARLGETYLRQGGYITAEEPLRECLKLRETSLAPGDWRIGEATSLLGAALKKQGRSSEAEQLLVAGDEVFTRGRMAQSKQAAAARARAQR